MNFETKSEESSHPKAVSTKGVVLVVDDEPALVSIMVTILEDHGFICFKSTSPREALAVVEANEAIGVVVSDLRMPKMNGIDFLRQLRRRFGDRHWLQVIFVTGYGTLDSAVEALRLDAVDFLNKPVSRNNLVQAVERAVSKSEMGLATASALGTGQAHLSRLSDVIKGVSELLASVSVCSGTRLGQQAERRPEVISNQRQSQYGTLVNRTELLSTIRAITIREKHFKEEFFADPAWRMLLFLMENRIQGREVYLINLYQSSNVPTSTAARRFEELREAGLINSWRDNRDRRRQLVALTPDAEKRIANYLCEFHSSPANANVPQCR